MYETIALVTAAASALFTMISAIAALRATQVSAQTQKDQRDSYVIGRRAAIYQDTVADPMREYRRSFLDDTTEILSLGVENLHHLREQDPKFQEMNAAYEKLRKQLFDRWGQLKLRLLPGIKAWGDEDLERAVLKAMQDMQDQLTSVINPWISEQARPLPLAIFRPLLEQHATEMTNLVTEHDPALRHWGGEAATRKSLFLPSPKPHGLSKPKDKS